MGKRIQNQSKLTTNDSLIISVGEARKLLGIDGQGMTDEELSAEIALLQELAIEVIKIKNIEKL